MVSANGQPIPLKKSVKVLGINLDRHLTFNDHFKKVKQCCKSRLNLLRTLCKRHQTSNRDVRLRVASAIIDSRLLYGIELTCSSTNALKTTLASVYHQSIRIASGLLPSTPADAACVESERLPFERLVTETVCKRAVGFLEKTTSCRGGVLLLDEANRLLQIHANEVLPPVAEIHWNGARSWDSPRLKLEMSIKTRFRAGANSQAVMSSVAELLRSKYQNFTHRYTDGSKAQDKIGIGVTDHETSRSYRLPDPCSIFSAEAAAVLIASTTPSPNPIAILTDSASVIAALSSDVARHPWIQAIQIQAPPDTVFIWIPGHCGIRGNEVADHLAASGRSATFFTRKVPGQDIRRWVSTSLRSCWAVCWHNMRTPFLRKIKKRCFTLG